MCVYKLQFLHLFVLICIIYYLLSSYAHTYMFLTNILVLQRILYFIIDVLNQQK